MFVPKLLQQKRIIALRSADKPDDDLHPAAQKNLKLLMSELPLKKAAALTAEIHGEKKNALYKLGLSWDLAQ